MKGLNGLFSQSAKGSYRNDPVCAEGQRIHSNADDKIKALSQVG